MAKKKATEDQFNELHNLITTEFLARIKSGEATTQDLKAACDWLKTNDISGVAYDGNPLSKLANVMPEIDPEMVQKRLYGSVGKSGSTTPITAKPLWSNAVISGNTTKNLVKLNAELHLSVLTERKAPTEMVTVKMFPIKRMGEPSQKLLRKNRARNRSRA